MIEKERISKESLIREALWNTKDDYELSDDDTYASFAVRDLISPPTGKIFDISKYK